MTDKRKIIAPPEPTGYKGEPTGYKGEPTGYAGEPNVTGSYTSDEIEVNISVKMKLDPEKLRCLQDCGITTTSNVVT